jgi:hypothetical protein
MIRRLVGRTLLCLAALGCDSLPTEISGPPVVPEADGLRLDGSISSEVVPVGQTHVLAFRLRNLTEEPITLHFGSGCQILPFIETRTGADVYPEGGGFICTLALTSLRVEPGTDAIRTMQVYGGPPPAADVYVGTPLPKGRYRAYAVVEGILGGVQRDVKLRSEFVEFEVR